MVIIKIDDSYADGDFFLLRRHLSLLDLELARLKAAIDVSDGLEVDSLRDSSEYFIGHGFVAIQRFLTETRTGLNIKMNEAFCVPPMTSHGESLVALINMGANYWKHVDEWPDDADELSGNALKTFTQLTAITPCAEYTCSNLLAILLEGQSLELSLLLPKIEEWRNNVFVRRTS